MKNEEVLLRVDEKNFLRTIKRRKDNCIGHILRENCLLKLVIEGKIEGTGRRGRGHAQLLDDLEEIRRYWKLYAFFWVIPRPLKFICRRFGTLFSIFIGR